MGEGFLTEVLIKIGAPCAGYPWTRWLLVATLSNAPRARSWSCSPGRGAHNVGGRIKASALILPWLPIGTSYSYVG